jgi:putative ABC transport system permease protein
VKPLRHALAGHVSRLLWVKLRRDIKDHGWQFAAVVAVVVVGVALYGASYDSYQDLKASYDAVHTTYRFADFTFEGGPWSLGTAQKVRAQPGVEFAEARVVVDPPVRLGRDLKLIGRVVGIPRYGQPSVNRLELVSGGWPGSGDDMWVFVEKHFAEAHKLKVGSSVEIHGPRGWQKYRVEGTVISPEYIWPSRSRQDIFPSTDDFGVLFAPNSAAAGIAGSGGQVNQLVIYTGGDEDPGARNSVRALLGPGRIDSVTPRSDQASEEALRADLDQFQELAGFFPAVFLGIGAISIYVMLSRLVHQQRPQIGLLRASGYARGTVVRHYLAFATAIAVVGAIPGVILGSLLARLQTTWYVTFLTIPITVVNIYPRTMLTGASLALIACLLAAWAPARAASKIQPAEAMRGETPAGGGRISIWERIIPPLRRLPALDKIPLRSVGRNRRRAVYTVLGIIFSNLLILMTLGMLDSTFYLIDWQFFTVQRQDVHVIYNRPLSRADAVRVAQVPGALAVEPVSELPVKLTHGDESYSTALIGMVPGTVMHQFEDGNGNRLDLPRRGLLLGSALKKLLGVEVGDSITVAVPELDASWKETVAGFETEMFGTFAYASIDSVSPRLAHAYSHSPEVIGGAVAQVGGRDLGAVTEGELRRNGTPPAIATLVQQQLGVTDDAATSAFIKVLPGWDATVVESLRKNDIVAAAQDSRSVYKYIQSYMDFTYFFIGIMLALGALMAFALIFNTMSVNILERTREIVTLRTLGIRQGQISWLVTAENMLLAALGIVPGLIAGYWFAAIAMNQFQNDLFTYSLHMQVSSFIVTAAVIQLTSLVAQVPALRAIHRVDMTKVIKERTS